jgi:hypothetical protein
VSITATGLTVMADSVVDGGTPPDISAEGGGYPSDLRDAEWARLEPLIPEAWPGGRPRKTDMRAAMNAILYLLRTSCPWRSAPRQLSAALDGLQHLSQVPA